MISGDQHSQAWTEYHQALSDRLGEIAAGVTDGSDATAGDVGEYMEKVGSGVALSNTVVAQLASLALTPGDWDVSGSVSFAAGAGNHGIFAAGINTIDSMISATMPTTALNQMLPTAQRRVNITAATTVWVVGQAAFSGTVTATGTIRARRVR